VGQGLADLLSEGRSPGAVIVDRSADAATRICRHAMGEDKRQVKTEPNARGPVGAGRPLPRGPTNPAAWACPPSRGSSAWSWRLAGGRAWA